MKVTQTKTTKRGIKITQTEATDADGTERITVTASIKKNGKLYLAQRVKVNAGEGWKTLYTRSQNSKNMQWREAFTWFRLGLRLELINFPKVEQNP